MEKQHLKCEIKSSVCIKSVLKYEILLKCENIFSMQMNCYKIIQIG